MNNQPSITMNGVDFDVLISLVLNEDGMVQLNVSIWERCLAPEDGGYFQYCLDADNLAILLRRGRTAAQERLLCDNPHLIAVERLSDGDLLVVDNQPAPPNFFPTGPYGPYVLTRDGKVQDVNYHFAVYHKVPAPYLGGRRFSEVI